MINLFEQDFYDCFDEDCQDLYQNNQEEMASQDNLSYEYPNVNYLTFEINLFDNINTEVPNVKD